MYKCTKFTMHKNLITPAQFLLYSENLELLLLPVVKPPDLPVCDVMQSRQCVRVSVDSGYSSCELSHIVIRKPHSDLRWTCQRNSMAYKK